MSETPKVGQKPAPQIPVSTEPAKATPAVEAPEPRNTPQKTQAHQPGNGMAISRPMLQRAEVQQPLKGAFRQTTAAKRRLNLGGLDTDPKILSRSTLGLLTASGQSAEYRATIGEWVGMFA